MDAGVLMDLLFPAWWSQTIRLRSCWIINLRVSITVMMFLDHQGQFNRIFLSFGLTFRRADWPAILTKGISRQAILQLWNWSSTKLTFLVALLDHDTIMHLCLFVIRLLLRSNYPKLARCCSCCGGLHMLIGKKSKTVSLNFGWLTRTKSVDSLLM